jgi:uncharacterized protein (DUF362 family)
VIKRRHFLGLLTGEIAALSLRAATTTYQAGIGSSSDPYTATQRAIAASGQFPAAAIAGSTVVIKPNLVEGRPASTGATTDPQVVRAVVDQALAAGAFSIIVAEGGVGASPVPFSACGYDFLSTYNPRVQLMDLSGQPYSSVPVPSGLALKSLYLPNLILEPNVVLISVAKLKTHSDAGITASMKNLFSLPVPVEYSIPGKVLKRQDLHYRGIDQCIVDVNVVAGADFAVIDGIVGMEGDGPLFGTPVTMNLVIAGLNQVAVDLVALKVMKIEQSTVPHLTYAALRGLGPLDMSKVAILGDSYTPVAFTSAKPPPVIWRPSVFPASFSPASKQTAFISYSVPAACLTSAAIIQDNDKRPGITVVKTLQGWTQTSAGVKTLNWAGDTDAGGTAAPGLYLAQVMSTRKTGATINYATSWVTVTS